MAQKQQLYSVTELDIRKILDAGRINSEVEFQRASMADRSLRMLSEEDPSLNDIRIPLRQLLRNYEKDHWSDTDAITEQQVAESDAAEAIAFAELKFVDRRRKLILDELKKLKLKQKDLATLLNHSQSYTSELLNGVRAFSTGDLILIHKLLKIDLHDLLITTLSAEVQQKVAAAIEQIAMKNKNANVSKLSLSNK